MVLRAGDYEARIVTVGAGLAGLTYRGHELIVPHRVDECPPAYLGKVLMPWPNRVAGGAYSWEGASYDLPVDEPAFGTSLHGFVAFQDWQVDRADASCVQLSTLIAARYSYPWTLLASARYSLDARASPLSCPRRTSGRARLPSASGSTRIWPSTASARTTSSSPTQHRSSTRRTRT